MWSVRVVQSEQHMICRLTASRGQGGPNKHGRNWQRKTAVSGSSPQLTLKKGAPGDQVWDLLCVQLASYLERGPLMWVMPLHLHVNKKSDYDDMMIFHNWQLYFRPLFPFLVDLTPDCLLTIVSSTPLSETMHTKRHYKKILADWQNGKKSGAWNFTPKSEYSERH